MTSNITLYRCKDCKKVFTSIGGCHGHIQGHFGLIETLTNLLRLNIEHLNDRTEKLIVKDYTVHESLE